MDTVTFIFLVLFITAIYMLIRNHDVYIFQLKISNGGYGYLIGFIDKFHNDDEFLAHKDEYDALYDKVTEMINRYSYIRMLFSFRNLTFYSWFTDEEIDILEEGLTVEI